MTPLKQLRKAESLHDLAQLLSYKPKALSYILYKIPEGDKYKEFFIEKKSGGKRKIKSPTEKLKKLQSRLAALLNSCHEEICHEHKKHSLSHAFRKKHSIITNASVHKNKRHVFNIDLRDFFPSIHFGRVRGFFLKNLHFELNEKVATIIAQIACHNNELPQGSPCSPVISNLIGHIMDVRMVNLAKKAKCTYSRYADDLTFSTNKKEFPRKIAYRKNEESHDWLLGKALEKEVKRALFSINEEKVSMHYKTGRQVATGLVVNEKVNIKREYYKQARSMCISLFHNGSFYLGGKTGEDGPTEGSLAQLDGILSHIYHVKRHHDDRGYGARREHPKGIAKLYRKFLFYKHFHSLGQPLIICEGKTDIIYLRCALRQLSRDYENLVTKNDGEYFFHISFLRFSKNFKDILSISEGSSGLRSLIEMYKKYMGPLKSEGKRHPVIILIDNDDGADDIFSKTLSKKDRTLPFYHHVENLYIVPTPRSKTDKNTMMEDFFDDETRAIKRRGKTFVPKDKVNEQTEYGKRIFAEEVIATNQNKINFNGYREILDRLAAVIVDYNSKNKNQ